MAKKKSAKRNKALGFLGKCIWYPLKGLWFLLKWAGIGIFVGSRAVVRQVKKRKAEKATAPLRKMPQNLKPLQQVERISGTLLSFEKMIRVNKSTIGLILGARGKGKSALGLRLLENIHAATNRPCYAIGFKQETLPDWIKVVENTDDIGNNGVVLIDEGGILFSSRNSMSDANKVLSTLLLIARHKDLSVIFISQNSSNLEINAIRQADYLLLKQSSLLQKDFERKKINEIYSEVQGKFDQYEDVVGLTYIYSDSYRGFVTNTLPSFWSEAVSKSFRGEKED